MGLQSQRAGDIGNSDKTVAAPAPATRFVPVLKPLPGIDAIRVLRRTLKHLLREHGMRVRERCPVTLATVGGCA
jgi:hypothetical protein